MPNNPYLSNTLTNLCIALYCILLYCVALNFIVLLFYCYVDIIQYNAMHKFVGVLDSPQTILTQSLLTKPFTKKVRCLAVLVYSFIFSAPFSLATKRLVIKLIWMNSLITQDPNIKTGTIWNIRAKIHN